MDNRRSMTGGVFRYGIVSFFATFLTVQYSYIVLNDEYASLNVQSNGRVLNEIFWQILG